MSIKLLIIILGDIRMKNIGAELDKLIVQHDSLKQYVGIINAYLKNRKNGGLTQSNNSFYSRGVELNTNFYQLKVCMEILSLVAGKKLEVLEKSKALVNRNLNFLGVLLEALKDKGVTDRNLVTVLAKYYNCMSKEYDLLEDNIGEYVLNQSGYSNYVKLPMEIRITVITDILYNTSLRDRQMILSQFNEQELVNLCRVCANEYIQHMQRFSDYKVLDKAVDKLERKWDRNFDINYNRIKREKERLEARRQKEKQREEDIKYKESRRKDELHCQEMTMELRMQMALGHYASAIENAIDTDNSMLYFHPDDWKKFRDELDKLCGDDEGIFFEMIFIGQYFNAPGECRCYMRNRAEGELKDASTVSRRTLKIQEAKIIRLRAVEAYESNKRPLVGFCDLDFEQDREFILHKDLGLATLVRVFDWRNSMWDLREKAKKNDYSKGLEKRYYSRLNYG